MVAMKRCGLFAALACGLLFFASCAQKSAQITSSVPEEELPRKVAILPFSNSSHNDNAGPVVRKMFYNFFSSLNYVDMEQSRIDQRLQSAGLFDDIANGGEIPVEKVCQTLGVDALISGEVTAFGKIYAILYSEVNAGLKARMISCSNGRTIWENEHTAHIREGGVSISPLGLASTAARVLLNLRQTKTMRVVSDLCMDMTATIPNPHSVAPPGPAIKVMVHNGANRLLTPGERLKVVIIGEPGMNASVEITPNGKKITMLEKEPGVYAGAYEVRPADRILSGQLTGYLESPDGGRSRWLDVLGPVTMGNPVVLPPRVHGNLVLDAQNSPYLIREALVVGRGDSLSIGPGTSVWIEGLGIVVQGKFSVKGTPSEKVVFSPNGQTPWKGILLDSPAANTDIAYVVIQGANRGLTANNASVALRNSTFTENVWGIVLDSCSASVTNCTISQSARAGLAARNSTISVQGSNIVENSDTGILLKDTTADIQGNNIFNNGKWNLKVTGSGSKRVDAHHNWWGMAVGRSGDFRISGPVKFEPVLNAPASKKTHEAGP